MPPVKGVNSEETDCSSNNISGYDLKYHVQYQEQHRYCHSCGTVCHCHLFHIVYVFDSVWGCWGGWASIVEFMAAQRRPFWIIRALSCLLKVEPESPNSHGICRIARAAANRWHAMYLSDPSLLFFPCQASPLSPLPWDPGARARL